MPDATAGHAKALDASRRVLYQGKLISLVLLDHARPNRRGYDALLTVESGWHLQKNKGELPTLKIAEIGAVTKELLLKAANVGFAIEGEVYKVDTNKFNTPYPMDRIWEFTVKPTGQQYP